MCIIHHTRFAIKLQVYMNADICMVKFCNSMYILLILHSMMIVKTHSVLMRMEKEWGTWRC